MPVGGVDELFARREDAVIRQHRKVQHHLIHLGIAVASDTAKPVLQAVQLRDDLFGRIVPGQVVPRAVIEQIPQQEQPPGPLPLESLHHPFTIVRRPVQVGCDHPFHSVPSILVWLHCTTKWTLEKSFVKSHTFDLTISPFRGILSQAGRKAAFPVFLPARVPVLSGGVP